MEDATKKKMKKMKISLFLEFYSNVKKKLMEDIAMENFEFKEEMHTLAKNYINMLDITFDKALRIISEKKYERVMKILTKDDRTKEEKQMLSKASCAK